MKDLMKKVKSFVTFDFPLQTAYISTHFVNTHKKFQAGISGWSTAATRQKVIADYWLRFVAWHFAMIFGLPVVMALLLQNFNQCYYYLGSLMIAGFVTFPVLYSFLYRPYFISAFLPRLETVKEIYEHKQSVQLEKCRQAQLSNFALTLVMYVLDKTSGIHSLQCNDKTAELLMRLYGVDKGSLKKNLEIIYTRKNKISPRKLTEVINRIDEAIIFFDAVTFPKGVMILNELRQKFLVSY